MQTKHTGDTHFVGNIESRKAGQLVAVDEIRDILCGGVLFFRGMLFATLFCLPVWTAILLACLY
jgi:hypothetical protein